MAQKLDPNETLPIEELVRMELIYSEALKNILVRKGITTEEELYDEIMKVKNELLKGE
jgi:hypothetical protein